MVGKKITFKGIKEVAVDSFKGFSEHKIVKLSASLAYYTVFSMGPMIMCVIFLANIFYGREAVEGQVFGQIKSFIGPGAAAQIQEIISNAALNGGGSFTAVVGFVTLLIGATTVFSEIQDSINTIWNLKIKADTGWWKMLITRLLSFSIIVSLGFLLLVSLVLNALIEGLMSRLQQIFPDITVVLLYILNLLITLFVTSLLFAIIFKVLPDARIRWRDIRTGAITTAILFMIGKFGITFYIGSSDMGSTYGAAGSLVVLLVWVYYSSIILYFGAEFTRVYAAKYGERIHPNQYAVWIKEVQVEDGKGSLQNHEVKKKAEQEKPGPEKRVS